MDNFVIGIDGGGTETKGVLSNSLGMILSQYTGAATNYQVVGGKKLKEELEQIFAHLVDDVKINLKKVSKIYLGLAGAGRESDRQEIKALFTQEKYASNIIVESDARVALAGAFGGKPGIILISGTGAICFGKNDKGPLVRSGGWGYLLGDEGSGYFVGQQAIIAALKELDGRGEQTALRGILESQYKLNQIDEIIPLIYKGKIDRTEIASLARIVFDTAAKGDTVAMNIVKQTGQELGKLCKAVAQKLNLRNRTIPVALIGGLFNAKDVFINEIFKELFELSWDIEVMNPMFSPAVGAAILALEESRVKISDEILANLSKTNVVKESGR
ncbi:hypothetical protein JXJ21_05650 [candidate division KSB1 bacterium]|nr:hypothetical protein [candidate division KSB1 bacterium]